MRWTEAHVLYLDVETTGLSPRNSCIVQYASELHSPALMGSADLIIKPDRTLRNVHIHGLTPDVFEDEHVVDWPQAWKLIAREIDFASCVVGYRVHFDHSHLTYQAGRYGQEMPAALWLDAQVFARTHPELGSTRRLSLWDAAERWGVNLDGLTPHRAADDVTVTRRLWEAMLPELPETLEETAALGRELEEYYHGK